MYTNNNKAMPVSLQNSLERSLAQQQALVRSIYLLKTALLHYPALIARISPFLNAFGDKSINSMHQCVGKFQELENSLRSISDALLEAEEERVLDPKRAVKICALDSLARGERGAGVGNLVNALRLHSGSLKTASLRLVESRERMVTEVQSERDKWREIMTGVKAGMARTVEMGAFKKSLFNEKGIHEKDGEDVARRPRSAQMKTKPSITGRRKSQDSSSSTTPKSSMQPMWNS